MRKRLQTIQAIRAIAFILIFLSHAKIVSSGPAGVSLFFVMSGFCMTYAYLDREDKIPDHGFRNDIQFAFKKIRKIYPLHLCTLFAVALMTVLLLYKQKASVQDYTVQSAYFAFNVLLLQSWIPWEEGYFSFNAVSWYLSSAAFSYFMFPKLFGIIQSKDNKKIAKLGIGTITIMVLIAIILGIARSLFGFTNIFLKWVTYISPVYRMGDFIIGMITGYFFLSRKKKNSELSASFIESFIIFAMALQIVIYNKGLRSPNYMLSLFWLPTSVLTIFYFSLEEGFISRFLSRNKALIWIGDISSEAFLIHHICIKAVEMFVDNKTIIAVVGFILTIVCTVFWDKVIKHLFDKRV